MAAVAHNDDRFLDGGFCRGGKTFANRKWGGFGCIRQHGQTDGGNYGPAQ
jgi:hypothetical protein